ncbi:MltR family transcriptional regulator [Geomonas nitrogeniifigens]|uniref:MltR family transcriptional regulator n=1 Tax=Geomonas diazotrophica TaxID=2843197 RepID=A0ABX8JKV2_9BACT|nr:MltR family transcriptional regulator [Geomonas nitrogeniifigens]QWV96090.1 MltR family transcriptional regulator [Geomonas nitrogeniifigens]
MKPVEVGLQDYNSVVDLFINESDRAAAVLAGSFIEHWLAGYLRTFMVEDPIVDNLFHGFGPFANYNQRVDSLFALGKIDKTRRDDLKIIGKIRNHFAHHPFDATFDSEPVASHCLQLSTYGQPINTGDQNEINRGSYLMAISSCIVNCHNELGLRMFKAELRSTRYK